MGVKMGCDPFYDYDCPTHHGIWYHLVHWVAGSAFWTILAYVGIVITLLVVYNILRYLRQPFCYYCQQEGVNRRTDGEDEHGRPECAEHYWQRLADNEKQLDCPIHGLLMEKQLVEGTFLADICPNGCTFLNPGELAKLRSIDQNSANNTMYASIAASSAAIAAINAGN